MPYRSQLRNLRALRTLGFLQRLVSGAELTGNGHSSHQVTRQELEQTSDRDEGGEHPVSRR